MPCFISHFVAWPMSHGFVIPLAVEGAAAWPGCLMNHCHEATKQQLGRKCGLFQKFHQPPDDQVS